MRNLHLSSTLRTCTLRNIQNMFKNQIYLCKIRSVETSTQLNCSRTHTGSTPPLCYWTRSCHDIQLPLTVLFSTCNGGNGYYYPKVWWMRYVTHARLKKGNFVSGWHSTPASIHTIYFSIAAVIIVRLRIIVSSWAAIHAWLLIGFAWIWTTALWSREKVVGQS